VSVVVLLGIISIDRLHHESIETFHRDLGSSAVAEPVSSVVGILVEDPGFVDEGPCQLKSSVVKCIISLQTPSLRLAERERTN
jgi:hypothetical protein